MSRSVKIPAASDRQRVRRGSVEDQEGLRREIIAAAFLIIERYGVAAMSMRAVATEVGLSAMALYRYFESKADLLRALGEVVMIEAESEKVAALAAQPTAKARLCASVDSFIAYWEAHPARFNLFYMTPETMVGGQGSPLASATAYRRNVARTDALIADFIAEVNGNPERASLARDLRLSLMLGYLHSKIVNLRFPWKDLDALRASAIDTIMLGLEACVRKTDEREPARPGAAKPRAAVS